MHIVYQASPQEGEAIGWGYHSVRGNVIGNFVQFSWNHSANLDRAQLKNGMAQLKNGMEVGDSGASALADALIESEAELENTAIKFYKIVARLQYV